MTTDDLAIEFKGRHEHISPRMREHAFRKLARLQRYNDRIARIEVVADNAHDDPEVEVIAHMRRGQPVVARQRARSFATAIQQLVEKMERQLKKQKEKRKDHKVDGARTGGRARRRGAAREETDEEVVRRNPRG